MQEPILRASHRVVLFTRRTSHTPFRCRSLGERQFQMVISRPDFGDHWETVTICWQRKPDPAWAPASYRTGRLVDLPLYDSQPNLTVPAKVSGSIGMAVP